MKMENAGCYLKLKKNCKHHTIKARDMDPEADADP
jgi:hypothetical protein